MLHEGSKSLLVGSYEECAKCENIIKARTSMVWGRGIIDAPIVFVGEAPGYQEDAGGIPFIGDAGDKLWELIELAEIPNKWVYITNSLLCRPTKPAEHLRTLYDNRTPTKIEIDNCRERLLYEICKVDPLVIVALGGIALQSLFGKAMTVGSVIGTTLDIAVQSPNGFNLRYCVVPAYHPSYILRGPAESDVELTIRAFELAKRVVEYGQEGIDS
jgi:DNA polymerase